VQHDLLLKAVFPACQYGRVASRRGRCHLCRCLHRSTGLPATPWAVSFWAPASGHTRTARTRRGHPLSAAA